MSGKHYKIRMELIEAVSVAYLHLYYNSTSISTTTIPASQFFMASGAVGNISQNILSNWPTGYQLDNEAAPTACFEVCGDGLRVGTEKWDDNNVVDGDGCMSACISVEAGWVWSGGSSTSADTCTECTSGYYQNDPITPTTWVTQCGDGFEVGTEKWDDGNTDDGDGCKSDCSTVEADWVWSGGSATTADTCTQCTSGYYQNDSTDPTTWVSQCGDGFEVGTEKWDDGNTNDGDGCKSDCSSVESGWVWSGGSPTSKDTCTQWPAGFYQNDSTNPTECVTVCGDGLRVGNEVWDEGNTLDTDGWAGNWGSIQTNWICNGGNSTSKDICTEWGEGETNNQEHTQWVNNDQEDSYMTYANSATAIMVVAGTASISFSSLLNNSPSQSAFSMVNAVQLLILLPLIGVFIPANLLSLIKSMSFSLLDLNFLSLNKIPLILNFMNDIDYEQKNEYLKSIELESGNSIINTFTLLSFSLILPLLHLIFTIVFCKIKRRFNERNWCHRLIKRLHNSMTFDWYLRYMYEVYLILILNALSAIYQYIHYEQYNTPGLTSLMFSICILTVCGLFVWLSIQQWLKSFNKEKFSRMHYFVEFFNGVRDMPRTRSHCVMYFMRRTLLWCLAVLLNIDSLLMLKISLFFGIQFWYFAFSLLRPFTEKKDNFFEILNEIIFTILWGGFFVLQERSDWNIWIETCYLGLIVASNLIISLVGIGRSILILYFSIFNKSNNKLLKEEKHEKELSSKSRQLKT